MSNVDGLSAFGALLPGLMVNATSMAPQLDKVGEHLKSAALLSKSAQNPALTQDLNKLVSQYEAIAAKNKEIIQNLESGNAVPGEYADLVQQMYQLDPTFSSVQKMLEDLPNRTNDPTDITAIGGYLKKAINEAGQIPFSEMRNIGNELSRQAKPTPSETVTTKSNASAAKGNKAVDKKEEQAAAPAENWGVKFSYSMTESMAAGFAGPANQTQNNYFLSLLPAMASQLPLQGAKDVPGSMPGLSFKVVPSVAKLKVPGFQPVFQHLGMDTVMVTMVGCFTGADGAQLLTDSNAKQSQIQNSALGGATLFDSYGVPGKSGEEGLRQIVSQLDSYRNFQEFYQFAVLQGRELLVEINLAKNSPVKVDQKAGDKNLRSANGNPKFKAVVKSMEVYHARSDRTWYTIQLEVTDFGLAGEKPINLTNALSSRIQDAQAAKANEQLKAKDTEYDAMQEKLRNLKYKQSLLDNGNYLYEFNDGTAVLQYINNGAVDFRQVSGQELEDLQKRIQGEMSFGDGLKLLGSGIGCALGIATAATGVGALAAAGLCGTAVGFAFKDAAEKNADFKEGAITAAIDVFLSAPGKVIGAGGKGLTLLKNTKVGGVIQWAENGLKSVGSGAQNIGKGLKIPYTSEVTKAAGTVIQKGKETIVRLVPEGKPKEFMDAVGKALFEPGAYKSNVPVVKPNITFGKTALSTDAANVFKPETPPVINLNGREELLALPAPKEAIPAVGNVNPLADPQPPILMPAPQERLLLTGPGQTTGAALTQLTYTDLGKTITVDSSANVVNQGTRITSGTPTQVSNLIQK